MPPEITTRAAVSPARQNAVIAALAFAGMGSSFLQTLLIPLQSHLPRLLDSTPSSTAWVITITLLVSAVMTPIAGKLGDMYGKRRVACTLLGAMVIGSIVCALSTGLGGLVIGRGLQGMGSGVIPLGIALLRDVLSREKLGGAISLVSATLGVGGAIGLPISAYVTEHYEWHLLFWITTCSGLLALALLLWVVPKDQPGTGGSVDVIGALGLAVALAGLLLGVSQGNSWGWTSPAILTCFGVGIVAFVLWVLYELRIANPIVDLRVTVLPPVLMTNLASVAMGFALFSSSIAFPQLLQLPTEIGGFGVPLFYAALMLMPSGVAMLIVSPMAGKAQAKWGPRPLLVAGALILTVAYGLCFALQLKPWEISLMNLLLGIGVGLGYAAMPALVMRAVPLTQTASANGVNTLMRAFGTTVAAAVVGAILAGADHSDMLGAFRIVFLLGIFASATCAVLAFLIPVRKDA